MLYTIFTVMNTTIGSGILAMPYTVYVLGWAFSLIVFLFITLANQYSVIILLKVKNLSKHSNYSTVASYIAKGKWFSFAVSAIIFSGNVGFSKFLYI